MGFWDFLRKNPSEHPPPEERRPTSAPPPAEGPAPGVARLAKIGLVGGPSLDEAMMIFAGLRASPDEGRAVDELARAAKERTIPAPLLLALASTLVDRGEREAAERVLVGASSSDALMLLADLAEARADVPRALTLVERVLLRDLDHPGARERHKRWRLELGLEAPLRAAPAGATVVTRDADAPFDLLREVGRGGAGAVYEAIDRDLGRHVALKVYHQPERDRAQLTHEARVAVALAGPGVVPVLDIDPDHGWVALAWSRGGAIRDHLRARATDRILPVEKWVAALAFALSRVHAGGWVHLDVKPANVLISDTGAPLLTDFGIARRAGEASPGGSLGYVSPERIAGHVADPRDDVYGFGRVIEDVLDMTDDPIILGRWRPMVAVCTGPAEQRPADGRALLTRLRVEMGL